MQERQHQPQQDQQDLLQQQQQQQQQQHQQQEESRESEEDWLDSMEATAMKVQQALEPYRSAMLLSVGAIACFYGRRFTYSVLFWRAFRVSGWPAARRAAEELRQRYRAAQAAARREWPQGFPSFQAASDAARQTVARLQVVQDAYQSVQQSGDMSAADVLAFEVTALQDDLVPARRAGSALVAISAELQPERLLELWRGLYAALCAALSAAMLEGAGLLGLSMNIGESVASTINRVMAPWLHALVDRVTERSSREVQQLREDPNARRWVELAVNGVCNSLGIVAAFFVEGRLFTISNARVGAAIMAREGFEILVRKGVVLPKAASEALEVRIVECLLFGAGVYFQFFRGTRSIAGLLWSISWGSHHLPGTVRLILSPALVLETWLQTLVTAMRVGVAK